MEAVMLKTKRTSEGNIKATVKCCFCNKINSHGSDKSIVAWRGCDGCYKNYRVSF